MKQCTKCLIYKNKELFCKDSSKKDGYYSSCKDCKKIYFNSINGLISLMYGQHKRRGRERSYGLTIYNKEEFNNWIKSQNNFITLYNCWKQSGYKKDLIPSCDRLDDYKGYTLDNIQLTTWGQNKIKGHNDRKNGINNKQSRSILQIDINTGNIIKEYYSISEAARKTLIHRIAISNNCNGKSDTSGGFIWKHNSI